MKRDRDPDRTGGEAEPLLEMRGVRIEGFSDETCTPSSAASI
jgi:hypothetical protein